MREILFKAKRLDNGEWVEGYVVYRNKGSEFESCGIIQSTFSTTDSKVAYLFNFTEIQVDPETVCQYTGLTDKKCVKAFENDKVYDPEENRIFTIKWDSELARFVLVDDNGWSKKDITRLFYCEIIGNIYDKEG